MKKGKWIFLILMFLVVCSITAFAGEWKRKEGGGQLQRQYEKSSAGSAKDAKSGPDGYEGPDDGTWAQDKTAWTQPVENDNLEGEQMMTIQIGEQSFEAVLYDHASAKAFQSRLPLTVTMDELNGNEKYFYLPEDLPADSRDVGSIHAGDLMLFGSDCLVLFYEDFQTSYHYTGLGRIPDPTGLKAALGNESAVVTFRLDSLEE